MAAVLEKEETVVQVDDWIPSFGVVRDLPIKTLFSELETTFVAHLKAQRAILKIEDDLDFRLSFSFVYQMSTVQAFTMGNVGAVIRHFKEMGTKSLDSQDQNELAWRVFRNVFAIKDHEKRHELLDYKPSKKGEFSDEPKPELPSRLLGLKIGDVAATSLQTHGDKTGEVTQSFDLSQTMIKKIAKSAKFEDPLNLYEAKDAIMLVRSVEGSGEPFGVTLREEVQADLGLVCSPGRGFVTGGKGAHLAPKQQFLMLKYRTDDEEFSILSIMLESRFDLLSKFLGFQNELTLLDLRTSLAADSELSFMASLYFYIHYALSGAYADDVKSIHTSLKLDFDLQPSTMEGTAQGAGINAVRIPMGDEYRYLTPLHNYGLMVQIHQKYEEYKKYNPVLAKKEASAWRRLFKMVHVGGGNPQNTGAMFSSVISNGDIRAMRSNVRSQISGHRLLKQNVRAGRALFWVKKDTALDICGRAPVNDVQKLMGKLYKHSARKVARRTADLVNQAVHFLVMVSQVVEKGGISLLEYEAAVGDSVFRSERAIVLGRSNAKDLAVYGQYLQAKIFSMTNLTKAEKRVVAKTIVIQLQKKVGV